MKAREQQTASSLDKGHSRVESRQLTSTTALNDYLDWPGVGQVFQVERQRTIRGQTTTEIAYGITSLSRDRADAAKLLALIRDDWGIENSLHYVRDVTFGEDTCRVRTGHAFRTWPRSATWSSPCSTRPASRTKPPPYDDTPQNPKKPSPSSADHPKKIERPWG